MISTGGNAAIFMSANGIFAASFTSATVISADTETRGPKM
jgi:hypothetical protein